MAENGSFLLAIDIALLPKARKPICAVRSGFMLKTGILLKSIAILVIMSVAVRPGERTLRYIFEMHHQQVFSPDD